MTEDEHRSGDTTPTSGSDKMASKKKLQFNDLLVEIQALIVDKLFRPSDLKNICLVNKQLHEIAVKPLYRNVALDLGSPSDNRLAAFLSPKNIGLKYIRQLRLYLANVRDKCNQDQQAHLVTRMILEFLPEDILEEFSWCPWKPFSTDNLLLLYRKQRKMKWLEVMDLDRDVLPELKKSEKMQQDVFQHARKLALYPENRDTLRLAGFFVQKTADVLEELIVHANFHELPDPRDPIPTGDFVELRELNDTATGPGLLTNTIFSHMLPIDKCEPMKNLTSLRLHRISLRYCADTWCKLVDFTKMQYLRIYQCPGADSLFGQLSKANNLPIQLKALEIQHRDNSENETLDALDGFLCLVSGIRDLVIDLQHVKTLPAAAGIVRHKKTLELLNIHCSNDHSSGSTSLVHDTEELVYDAEDFEKICTSCTKLEQLSCAWPRTSLIRAPDEEWKSFERSTLGSLKELVSLHISTFPNNKPSTQLLPRDIYQHLLQGLAQRVFEMATILATEIIVDPTPSEDSTDDLPNIELFPRNSKLRLLAFGISEKIYEREDSKNQMIFLRSTCFNADSRESVYATPIGWCLRQYIEPRSEVLDFVLLRESRPPCRDITTSSTYGGWNDEDDDIAIDM